MELEFKPKYNPTPKSTPLNHSAPCPLPSRALLPDGGERGWVRPRAYILYISHAWVLVRVCLHFGYACLFLSFPLRLGAPRGLGPCLARLCVSAQWGVWHVSDGTGEWMGKKAGEDEWMARCLSWLGVGCFWKRCDFNANFRYKRKRAWTHFLGLTCLRACTLLPSSWQSLGDSWLCLF